MEENMINVTAKTCIHENCKTQPNFNFAGKNTGLYCVVHKKENMINVTAKTCVYENCKTRPSFNNAGENHPLYCSNIKKKI